MMPESCLDGHCWSPVACEGWGYCRHRNFDHGAPTDAEQQERRRLAAERRDEANSAHAAAAANVQSDRRVLVLNGD
jgi:hypothetical protein